MADEALTDAERDTLTARAALSPHFAGGAAASAWANKTMEGVKLVEAVTFIRDEATKAADGDLASAKRMLMAQSYTLDAIFNQLAQKAATLVTVAGDGSWSVKLQSLEALMRVALKAQSQSRTTLQTLGELVNPRSVAFIQQAPGSQANVSSGPQQVNNGHQGAAGATASPAENSEIGANRLLEANPSERLDLGTPATASGADQELETVGAVNRAEVGGGESRRRSQRAKARAAQR